MPRPDIVQEILGTDDFLVTCHISPDGDAIGSVLAMVSLLHALGKKATGVLPDPAPLRYHFLAGVSELVVVDDTSNHPAYKAAVILDAGEFGRIGQVAPLVGDGVKVINIDHHTSNDGFGDAAWVDASASATSEMLHDLFREFKITPDRDAAMAMYVAIMTDTGRFRFSNTTARTFATAAALVQQGANPAVAAEMVFYTTPKRVVNTLAKFLSRIELFENGRISMSNITLDEKNVDTEGFVDHISAIHGVEVCALLREIEKDKFKVSLRSNSDEIDVAAIAAEMGGGGHKKAAGCRVSGTLSQSKEILLSALKQAMNGKA